MLKDAYVGAFLPEVFNWVSNTPLLLNSKTKSPSPPLFTQGAVPPPPLPTPPPTVVVIANSTGCCCC